MKSYLFLFTIGPVQSFIAQARKTQDLFGGSRLLSDLCRIGARAFERYGTSAKGEIIFPSIQSASIPNRFMGKIDLEDDEQQAVGKAVQTAIEAAWMDIAKTALEKFGFDIAQEPFLEMQLSQHLEIHWAAHSLPDAQAESYRLGYRKLVQNLNANKLVRPFEQNIFGQGESGRKCSIDGERNVVIYRKTQSQENESISVLQDKFLFSRNNRVVEYGGKTGVALRFLQPGEGLSAVSITKRCYPNFEKTQFGSTANVALLQTLKVCTSNAGDSALFTQYAQLFDKEDDVFSMNGQLLYEDNLTPEYFRKQGIKPDKLKKAKEQQKILSDVLKKNGRSWDKYYAIIVSDGDQMGAWWSGQNLQPEAVLSDFHKDLSYKLALFAAHVTKEIEANDLGKVVYAGGDDFLGMFPLQHLFTVLFMLRNQYHEIVHKPLEGYRAAGANLTFSTGVSIAHYKEPLSLVLTKARKLEKEAKNWRSPAKNCFALGVIPGSGQITETVLPFEHLEMMHHIYDALSADFSSAFITKLRMECNTLMGREGKHALPKALSTQVIPQLVKRYIDRACNLAAGNDKLDKIKADAILNLQAQVHHLSEIIGFNAMLDTLEIIDFMERQTRLQPIQLSAPSL